MIGFCDIEKKGGNFEIKTRSNSKNTFEIKRTFSDIKSK
jgi:hypothetical protein